MTSTFSVSSDAVKSLLPPLDSCAMPDATISRPIQLVRECIKV